MDLNWSTDDSSSFTQWEESDVGPNTDAQDTGVNQLVPPSRQNDLLAIDDSDFQALIEILGTEGDRGANHPNPRNRALDSRRLIQGREQHGRRDEPTPAAARDVRNSNGPEPSRRQIESSRSMSLVPSRISGPISSPRAVKESAFLSSPARQTRTSTERNRTQQFASDTDRAASPGSSRLSGKPMSVQDPGLKAIASYTQSKLYLDTSIEDVKDQVSDLRTRLQVLKDEVKEFAPHLYRRAFHQPDTQSLSEPSPNQQRHEDKRGADAKGKGKAVQWSGSANGAHSELERDVIASLTEEEAKDALANVCQTLRIDPLTLVSPSEAPVPGDVSVAPFNLSDVSRALQLVADLDEIVWKNTDRRYLELGSSNIYDEENIRAILDRVRLWERTARSRASRRTCS